MPEPTRGTCVVCGCTDLDREVTKFQLDSWTAESKDAHRFPAVYLPALCKAVGSTNPLQVLVDATGAHLMTDRERLLDEQERELRQRRKLIEGALERRTR